MDTRLETLFFLWEITLLMSLFLQPRSQLRLYLKTFLSITPLSGF